MLRVLGANYEDSTLGADRSAETLTNDYFVNLLDMGTRVVSTTTAPTWYRRPRPAKPSGLAAALT